MKKDVIYIDIEDDITAVIEKLKNSKEKIIALVPPKGNAVLQSVVNLKLLKRAAEQAGKQPVIVTSNQALTALAGGLGLYIAKNLQSKPVLVGDEPEDVADDALEVSDESTDVADSPQHVDLQDDGDEVELSGEELAGLAAENEVAEDAKAKPAKAPKAKKSVPNFDDFRKRLLIVGGVLLFVSILLIFVFGKTKARITLSADTTPVDVAFEAKFNAASASSDPTTYNLKATSQQSKKTLTQSFNATGQKDIGTKSSGTMTISNCQTPTALTVPAGTVFSANGLDFVSDSTVSVPGAQGNFVSGCTKAGTAKVNVTASSNGDKYNLSARTYSNSLGEKVTSTGSQMSGGTSNIVKVVSQSDIDGAKDALSKQDTNQVRADLKKGFSSDIYVLEDTFTTNLGSINSEPSVGSQANTGQLTVEATYTILGVSKKDLGASLDYYITTKMTNKDQQRVYDNGIDNLKLEKTDASATTATYKVASAAQYGPQFDTADLKEQIKGKKFGETRSYLQGLPGVKGVDISLTPFWAHTMPDPSHITVKLDVDKSASVK